jgi:hypothetical protein
LKAQARQPVNDAASAMHEGESSQRQFVEEHLASELGWDLNLFHGASFQVPGLNLRMRAEYAIANTAAFFPPGQPRLNHLRLTKWLKFGNSVEQLHHLFYLAKTYKVRQIVLPPSKLFQARDLGEFEVTTANEDSANLGLGLAGLFYYLEPFCLKRPSESLLESARRYVRPMLSDVLQESDLRVGEDDLVLHFRAGDVFHHPVAHYGQPPLAYYLAAIEREKPSRTWLVFEDRANPCIDAAEAWLQRRGLEVVIQSGALEEDLRVLLSARRLVIGQGTFGSSVAMLSTHLRRLYTFKSDLWDDLRLSDLETIQGIDIDGGYTRVLLSKNWTASPEQCALMLSYPAEALRFDRAGVPES